MAVFASQPVEPIRERCLQPLHARDEVSLRSLHGQVTLRLEFPGALYHIINRGNYRRWHSE